MFFRCLLIAFFYTPVACAQSAGSPFALWAFPGLGWQQSAALRFTAQYGYNPQLDMHAVYLQAFLNTGRHVTLNPAYLYLDKRGSAATPEHTFMPAVIFSYPLGKFSIEDRNLFWIRLRNQTEDIYYYRNRLRLFLPITTRPLTMKAYLFDELFYFVDRGRWSRNRIAGGLIFDWTRRFNLDVSYVREQDHYGGGMNYIVVMGIVRFTNRLDQLR